MFRRLIAAVLVSWMAFLAAPGTADARPSWRRRDTHVVRPSHHHILDALIRPHTVYPQPFRTHQDYGWVYGTHGGSHWALDIGWHSRIHRGYYRPTDHRVFTPMHRRDHRFRGRF